MKTIRIKVYKFEELSEKAKQTAIQNWRAEETHDYIYDEAVQSLRKFCDIFSIDYNQFSFDEPYSNRYNFELDDKVLELSGQRLATYIWNNYKTEIFKGKYYGKLVKTFKDGTPIPVSKEHPAGMRHVKRYSRCTIDNSCVLTGVCWDQGVLHPIYEFLNKPTSSDFKDLLEACLDSLCKDVQGEIEARGEDDYITEELKNREEDYTANGERFPN